MPIQPKGIIIHSMAEYLKMVETPGKAFHAGKSLHEGLSGLNSHYLGFELLVPGEHDFGSFSKAIETPGTYTKEQFDTSVEVCKWWMNEYNIPASRVVRHSDAIAIFFILKQEPEQVDLSPYINKIEALEKKVDSLHSKNVALEKAADSLEVKISEYDIKIRNLNYNINFIKRETKAKLDSIDKFGDDELERFFSERYYSKTDSIN